MTYIIGVSNPTVRFPKFSIQSARISLIQFAMQQELDRKENRRKIRQNQMHLYDSERRIKDLIGFDQFKEDDKKGIDVPFFDLRSILAATNNFSDANKIGRGGFGAVYKGKFPGGQEIAVMRGLSTASQYFMEFTNEVVLLSKLQHWNFVRLLGYCINEDENILVYEYMPNKSLDFFIFDRMKCAVLDWELRFNIILGVARGLLYLHQDSKLRIIHKDLKPSTILLDEEMIPKISAFGLAKILDKENKAETDRIIGTHGYMSPEYVMEGFVSVKNDVFSFGIVVLEIISGIRTFDSNQLKEPALKDYAWRLWNEGKALDLMDQTLCKTCNKNEVLKCINVGLLCVANDPTDRPTMSDVVFMLDSKTATLPTPKQPAFIEQRGSSSTTSSSEQEIYSENE